MQTLALRYHRHGPAAEVLSADLLNLPLPGPGEVVVRMLAAPIHPSDLGAISGTYGSLPELPAVAGREGVGEIVASGPGVRLHLGQRVLLPEDTGSWQSLQLHPEEALWPVPEEIGIEQAAMAGINPPTALLLLESFVDLAPGDWIIQNAANSAVGHYVIRLCRHRGLRSINLVRNADWEKPLQAAGADIVLTDGPEIWKQIREKTGGVAPRLALNSVGGESAIGLIRSLADGGTLVTFGGMTGEPIRFPTRNLIFHDVRLVGFWLHRWKKTHPPRDFRSLMRRVFDLMASGVLDAPVEKTYPLGDWRAALAHASQPGRKGKILLAGLR